MSFSDETGSGTLDPLHPADYLSKCASKARDASRERFFLLTILAMCLKFAADEGRNSCYVPGIPPEQMEWLEAQLDKKGYSFNTNRNTSVIQVTWPQ